ncbi:hypothetical protein VPH35_090896 [Triticum aestivum]
MLLSVRGGWTEEEDQDGRRDGGAGRAVHTAAVVVLAFSPTHAASSRSARQRSRRLLCSFLSASPDRGSHREDIREATTGVEAASSTRSGAQRCRRPCRQAPARQGRGP